MSPDVRHACAMQLLILPGCRPTETDNTPRPRPMLLARCDGEFWPHKSMEALLPSYASLARAGDERRSAEHQDVPFHARTPL
jgi:hypothetical protein